MKAIGTVIKTEKNTATVVSERSSACSACHSCEARGACHAELIFGEQTQSVEVVAQNRAGAKKGDRVELESSTARTLFAAFSLFIVPFLITLVFYFISKEFFLSQKSFPLVLILVFCAAFFVMGKIVNGFIKKKHSIYVVRILEESKESLEAE